MRMKKIIAAVVLSALLVAATTTVALAFRGGNGPGAGRSASSTLYAACDGSGLQLGNGQMQGQENLWSLGGPENSLVAVTARTLQIDQPALVAELRTGKTLADVAEEHHVALDTIITAFLAPRVAYLQAQVADGTITQAQMDTQIAQMRAHLETILQQPWNPVGPGMGQCQ